MKKFDFVSMFFGALVSIAVIVALLLDPPRPVYAVAPGRLEGGVRMRPSAAAQPARAISPGYSWFYTPGYQSYDTLRYGYVHAATISYKDAIIGYYSIDGNAWVSDVPHLTHISGTCSQRPEMGAFSAILNIDNREALPLFNEPGGVGQVNITVRGKFFAIKIFTRAPTTCQLSFEPME